MAIMTKHTNPSRNSSSFLVLIASGILITYPSLLTTSSLSTSLSGSPPALILRMEAADSLDTSCVPGLDFPPHWQSCGPGPLGALFGRAAPRGLLFASFSTVETRLPGRRFNAAITTPVGFHANPTRTMQCFWNIPMMSLRS
jgi:hypothetical protein